MSHEITNTDNVFSVREPMWHGLGVVLPDYPTREEAQQLVHPWEPVVEPVYRRVLVPVGVDEHGNLVEEEQFEEVTDYRLNVRSDSHAPLGVVSKTYQLVGNGEMYDIAEVIEGTAKGSVRFETGGTLAGGKKVFLLIRLQEPIKVKGDPNGEVIPYYALQNDHTGLGAFRGQATLTRIVCANTSLMADLDAQARGTEMVFNHTKNIEERIAQAKAALAGWRESIETFNRLATLLVNTSVTPRQRELFVTEYVPMPLGHTVSDRVVANVEFARQQIRDILASPTCEGINTNAYGLVQSATEYLNWARKARTAETRFTRTYLTRNKAQADAVSLALEVSAV